MRELVVPVAAIRAAGAAAGQLAAGVGAVDPGSPCAAVAAALPGSRCAVVGVAAASAWRVEMTDLTARAGQQAQRLTECAETYEGHERRVVALLAAIGQGVRRW